MQKEEGEAAADCVGKEGSDIVGCVGSEEDYVAGCAGGEGNYVAGCAGGEEDDTTCAGDYGKDVSSVGVRGWESYWLYKLFGRRCC